MNEMLTRIAMVLDRYAFDPLPTVDDPGAFAWVLPKSETDKRNRQLTALAKARGVMTEIRSSCGKPIPLEAQIACLKREIALRKNVYKQWVASGKMQPAKADDEIGAMTAALHTLMALEGKPLV